MNSPQTIPVLYFTSFCSASLHLFCCHVKLFLFCFARVRHLVIGSNFERWLLNIIFRFDDRGYCNLLSTNPQIYSLRRISLFDEFRFDSFLSRDIHITLWILSITNNSKGVDFAYICSKCNWYGNQQPPDFRWHDRHVVVELGTRRRQFYDLKSSFNEVLWKFCSKENQGRHLQTWMQSHRRQFNDVRVVI